jgi:ankyrin repeat protein
MALCHGVLEVLCLLLEHGADVEVKHNDSMTALQFAADLERDKVMELL